jgi:hypothetical protein
MAEATDRFSASLIDPFPIFNPSPEAMERIRRLASLGREDTKSFKEVYNILIEDQSKHGLRIHKGFPLYALSKEAGKSDKQEALHLMLSAFVEDVLTHGDRAMQGFAATSLKDDFGISIKTLVTLKEFTIDRTKSVFYPEALVEEFVRTSDIRLETKESFRGVTEDSRCDSIVAQVGEKLRQDLRPSFSTPPKDEKEVQNVVFALLRQIDRKTNREKSGPRLANKEYTIDFSLFEDSVGVEVKLIDKKEKVGQTIDQINADIPAYIRMFKRVIFLVYDAYNAIVDEKRFVSELKDNRREIEVLVL